MNRFLVFLLLAGVFGCEQPVEEEEIRYELGSADCGPTLSEDPKGVQLVVLGVVQDAGSPQINCKKTCCADLFDNPDLSRKVVSLGLIDYDTQENYLFEATPDMPSQIHDLNLTTGSDLGKTPNGVFLTHAHIGHYTGLMYFGREAECR